MASSTSLRTIWITLRATNYTTNVFSNVVSNLSGLQAAEIKAVNASLNLGKAAMSAGMLFGVLGSQIGGSNGQLLQYASYVMYVVSAMSYLKAAILFINAELQEHNIVITLTATSWKELTAAIGGAVAGFVVIMEITNAFGRTAGIITGVAMAIIGLAIAILMFRAAAGDEAHALNTTAVMGAIGLAGGGAAGAVYAATQGHAMGTRMVGRTGPAILHKGEVVYNPSTGRPTQVGNDLQGGMGGGVTTIDASMTVGTLNTKMSDEQLNDALRKQGRKIANDRR